MAFLFDFPCPPGERQAPSLPHRITHGDSVSSTPLDQCPLQTSTSRPLCAPAKNREYARVGSKAIFHK